METRFSNRSQAGILLAQRLTGYVRQPDVIVLAIPRGGVPLGFAVAQLLEVPLDIVLVHKLGLPGFPEYAMGALATDGLCLLQSGEIARLGVPQEAVDAAIAGERQELARREMRYRAGRPAPQLQGKVVILVDDGIATGSTMQLAVCLVHRAHAARIIIAVPVAAAETCAALAQEVDAVICLSTPEPFFSVSQWYEDFGQTSDEEVTRLLGMARGESRSAHGTSPETDIL